MAKKEMQPKEELLTPRTKGIIFFLCYGIFFAVLLLSLRDNTTETSEKETITYSIDNILTENYHFVYELEENDAVIRYEGDRNKEKEKFVMTADDGATTYFNNNGTILEKKDTWALASTNPYLYPEFLDIKELNRLIKNSKYLSKTEYSTNETILNYQISTTTILELLTEEETDLDDLPNSISLYLEDGEVHQVILDLSSYTTYLKGESTSTTYTLTYSNIGQVKEIVQD